MCIPIKSAGQGDYPTRLRLGDSTQALKVTYTPYFEPATVAQGPKWITTRPRVYVDQACFSLKYDFTGWL